MHTDQNTKPTLDLETTASKQEEESDAETAATPYAWYIVAAFLVFANTHSEAAEVTMRNIGFDSARASWNQEVLTALEEVCHPLFFVSTNLQTRTGKQKIHKRCSNDGRGTQAFAPGLRQLDMCYRAME
jgi:hypothetical protein